MCGSVAAFAAMVNSMGEADFVLHRAKPPPKPASADALLEPETPPAPDTVCHTAWAITEVVNVQVSLPRPLCCCHCVLTL